MSPSDLPHNQGRGAVVLCAAKNDTGREYEFCRTRLGNDRWEDLDQPVTVLFRGVLTTAEVSP